MATAKYADKPDPTIKRLLDEAHKLEEEFRGEGGFLERRAAVRDSLRSLSRSGIAAKEQADEISELFPERKKNAEPVGSGASS